MTMKQDKIGCAVIGVGINVNMDSFPEEMADKATSLYLESGHLFDRAEVTGLVMKHFEENYELEEEDQLVCYGLYKNFMDFWKAL